MPVDVPDTGLLFFLENAMIMRAVVIDDEVNGRETLLLLLQKYCPDVEVAGTADSVESGQALIAETRPDLVFLDIEMPLGSGFDLLEQFPDHVFEVVFTTAHAQYACDAFRVQALDYLLKPIYYDRLAGAVERARTRISERRIYTQQQSSESLEFLLSVLVDKSVYSNKVALRTADGIEFVQVRDIIRCEAENCYTTFHLAGGEKLVLSRTLREFEDMLSGFNFLRVHNSHLVNVTHIKRYIKRDGGYVVMSDGASILLSRRHREELVRTIMESLATRG